MTDPTTLVPIEADRELAVSVLVELSSRGISPEVNAQFLRDTIDGDHDDDWLVRLIAQFRLQSIAALSAENERLREASYALAIRAGELVRAVRAMTKAENIHAAGIREMHRTGLDDAKTSRDDVDMLHADLYAAWPAKRLDALAATIRAALNTNPGDDR